MKSPSCRVALKNDKNNNEKDSGSFLLSYFPSLLCSWVDKIRPRDFVFNFRDPGPCCSVFFSSILILWQRNEERSPTLLWLLEMAHQTGPKAAPKRHFDVSILLYFLFTMNDFTSAIKSARAMCRDTEKLELIIIQCLLFIIIN